MMATPIVLIEVNDPKVYYYYYISFVSMMYVYTHVSLHVSVYILLNFNFVSDIWGQINILFFFFINNLLVQNSAARLVTGTRRREHITPVLFALYWLPIRQRIQFKLLLLVCRCIHQLAPVYLTDLVVPYVPARSLRSADQKLLSC